MAEEVLEGWDDFDPDFDDEDNDDDEDGHDGYKDHEKCCASSVGAGTSHAMEGVELVNSGLPLFVPKTQVCRMGWRRWSAPRQYRITESTAYD